VIRVLGFPIGARMSMTLKYDLPLLDLDTRFSLWQVKMWAVLAHHDLDDALEGFENKDRKAWTPDEVRKDRKALSMIHLQLSNNVLQECLEEKSAAALWLKLESICMANDLTSKMHIKMKLFTYKLQEGGSVLMHISVFKEIVADLISMEVKFDDEDLALLLLCSLPASFSNFRDTILYSHDTLTVAKMYEALTAKEKMRQMVNSEDVGGSSGEALNVRGRTKQKSNSGGKGKGNQRGRSKSKGPSGDLFCRYCNCKKKIMKLRTAGNCRTRRRGTTRSNQRVKLTVVPLLSPVIVLIMVMFLLPLLDVLLMMPNGYLILLVHIMSALTEICLVLMNLCRMEVLFKWATILLVQLLAWAPGRSRCLMGLYTH
jgi:hypothetical protein